MWYSTLDFCLRLIIICAVIFILSRLIMLPVADQVSSYSALLVFQQLFLSQWLFLNILLCSSFNNCICSCCQSCIALLGIYFDLYSLHKWLHDDSSGITNVYQSRDVDAVLVWDWPTVCDGGTISNQHSVKLSKQTIGFVWIYRWLLNDWLVPQADPLWTDVPAENVLGKKNFIKHNNKFINAESRAVKLSS